jgi:2-oxoglutarate ferredoxin oxidoreductase subunit gamma
MGFRYEIRLSGSGGQGIILMGIILAEATGIYEGRYVVQTQSYGPEARGGMSRSELIISDEEIDYPKVTAPDLLLAMNQKSCDAFFADLKQDGILILDSTFVDQIPPRDSFAIPFTRIARERLKSEISSNMIALGSIAEFSNVVSIRSLELAILSRLPKGSEKINKRALQIGIKEARKIKKEKAKMELPSQLTFDDIFDPF